MQWTSAPSMGEAPLPQRARGYWKTWVSASFGELEKLLEVERAQLPPWLVVGFGAGIAGWFVLDARSEWTAFLCIASALSLAGFALGSGRTGRALGWFALAATIGCALVWARSSWVAQPRLEHPRVVDLAAAVESVDHLATRETVRLLVKPHDAELPPHLRVSVDEDKFPAGVAPGAEIRVRARLAPPPSMALPGTFDFARDAWFQQIGAVGKALGPISVLRAAQPKGLDHVRDSLRKHIEKRLSPSSAGIAVAL